MVRKLSSKEKILATSLLAYIVLDFLLTPVAGIETRPVAQVTSLGVAELILLFIGLALALVCLALLVFRPRRSPIIATLAALLFLPAFFSEQIGTFSSIRPPTGIETIEVVQAVVAGVTIFLAFRIRASAT